MRRHEAAPEPRSSAWETAITVLQEVTPPSVPEGAHAMTVIVEYPPGDPGAPPHRHPSGPAFGYMFGRRDAVRTGGRATHFAEFRAEAGEREIPVMVLQPTTPV